MAGADTDVDKILRSALQGRVLTREEALALLRIANKSDDFYRLLATANRLTRTQFNNKAYIFAQIGINAEPCSQGCKFCSMSKNHYVMNGTWRKDAAGILAEVDAVTGQGIDDLFLMTTADYSVADFIETGKKVKIRLPEDMRLVANIGDFDYNTAIALKEAGFTGAYHINRLREGIDTGIKPAARIATIEAIVKAGLELYYCVEPIGPEHSYDELVEEMLRARDYDVKVMAVMRRIPVPGTLLCDKGQITALELAKIAAVTRLVSRPSRAMNAHEVTPVTLVGGVNQLYAEIGANPRDSKSDTENHRGFSVARIKDLFADAEYSLS